MCGIAWIAKRGSAPIDRSQLDALLVGNMSRGRDATGLALMDKDGGIQVHKSAMAATGFITSKGYEDFLDKYLEGCQIAILHTRLMTTGHWSKHENNHPLQGEHVALVHNGMIGNYKEMFQTTGLEAKCETDSDILRAVVDVDGLSHLAIRNLSKVSGSAAIAVVDNRHPGQLLLGRSGNPLEIALTDDFAYGSSTRQPIYVANKQWRKDWGMYCGSNNSKLAWTVMPDNTACLIDLNKDGLQWHQEFKTSPYTTSYHHYNQADWDQWDRQFEDRYGPGTVQRVTVERPNLDMTPTGIEYKCPHCHDMVFVPKWLAHNKMHPEQLKCGKCDKFMKGARRYYAARAKGSNTKVSKEWQETRKETQNA